MKYQTENILEEIFPKCNLLSGWTVGLVEREQRNKVVLRLFGLNLS